MKVRVVNLLGPIRDESATRRAQRKYRRTAKGRAAQARAYAKWIARPENRAKAIARSIKWARDNPIAKRVYGRVWIATKRRLARAAQLQPLRMAA